MFTLKKLTPFLSILTFVLFLLLVFWSNQLDWDHFYSSAEADLRSLLVFHELPLWSYQFCAGVTRIGDPQSFSLSPLFLFHLIFGTILGFKLLIVSLNLLGIYFGKKILELFVDIEPTFLWAISVITLTSNFFIWHTIAGHVTFALFHLGLGILYYFLKEAHCSYFSWKRSIALFFLIQSLFSAAFYPVVVYLFIPLIPLFAFFTITKFRKLRSFFLATLLGLLFSAYKWISVLDYQLKHPRVLGGIDNEKTSLVELIGHFISPSSFTKVLLPFKELHQWAVWEYSFFTPLILLFIFLFFALRWEPLDTNKMLRKVVFFATLPFILSLGFQGPYSPYTFLNHYIFNDSLRVHSRFALSLLFLISFTAAYLLEKLPSLRRKHLFISIILGLNLINLLCFLSQSSPKRLSHLLDLSEKDSFVQNRVWVSRQFSDEAFLPIVQGAAVANCYNPLNRNVFLLKKMQIQAEKIPTVKSFISGDHLDKNCLTDSHFSANRIYISKDCPRQLCLELNDINTTTNSEFVFNDQKMAYCRQE